MSFSSDTPLHQQPDTSADVPAREPIHLDVEDFPFDDPAKELRFQQARAELFTVSDPRTRINWWLLIILAFGVLLLFQQGVMSYQHMGILVGVLLFHEFCHFVLMRSFGYSDLQLYFLPLFSTLLNSRKYVAAAWKQAWVIHIAPLVGIVTALFLYLILREEMTTLAWFTIITLLTINGVNLIPLQFFDAGKFFAVVLFNRNAWIESGVQLISALAIGLFALANRSFYLGLLSLFMLTGTPLIFRRGQMITKLRSTGISLPETLEELQPLHQRMLFAATYDVLGATRADPKLLAQYMRELYYRVLVPPPGWLATLALIMLYLVTWLLLLVTIATARNDIIELRSKLLRENMMKVVPKQVRVSQLEQEVQQKEGEAKRQAENKLNQARLELNDAQEELKPLRERLRAFELLDRRQERDPLREFIELDQEQ